eukprot:COSAG06_NODE_70453_length_192_cov_17.806452_2_plen_31_part_01
MARSTLIGSDPPKVYEIPASEFKTIADDFMI